MYIVVDIYFSAFWGNFSDQLLLIYFNNLESAKYIHIRLIFSSLGLLSNRHDRANAIIHASASTPKCKNPRLAKNV